MKRIILCTIPGTGTQFFRELLEDHGFDVKAVHCTDHALSIVEDEIANGSILVTTYRDVEDIYECWGNRELVGKHPPKRDDLKYFESWYRLFRWEPVVVSLHHERDIRLKLLSAVLGKELKADWEAIRTKPIRKYDIHTDTWEKPKLGIGDKRDYAFAIDSGYQGSYEDYKEWRATEDGVTDGR